ECQKKYGDICEFYIGNPSNKTRGVILGRSDFLEKIYSTKIQTSNFIHRTPPNDGLDEYGFSTKGIVYNRNFDTWIYYRKFFMRAIMAPKFIKQTLVWTEGNFEEMESYWKELYGKDSFELDLSQWLLRFTTETIFQITSNKKVYALANYFNKLSPKGKLGFDTTVLKESEEFIHRVEDFITSLIYFLLTPKFLRYFPIGGSYQRTLKLLKERDNLINDLMNLVAKRREEIDNTPLDEPITPDMLTMLITVNTKRSIIENTNDANTEPMTDDAIVGNFMEAVAGGVDTTAASACYVGYYLAQYPEVKKRVFEEIDSKFTRDQKLTLEVLDKLPYCEAVIRETSRLLPIADLNYRMNTKEEILGGYVIPAETQIYIHHYGMNKHKAHWSNPEEFNPDRFLNDREKSMNFQFGGGIRMCPGRNLAMMELKALMVLMYRKYDIELADKNVPLKTHYTIIRHCDEFRVRLKPRVI
ncbi:3605_t:CDS:2, partial [Funneliformis geosporum]